MKRIKILLLIIIPSVSFGQFGVSIHQSNLPFAGFSYEFKNKIRPEIRVATDNYFYALSVEGVLTYDVLKKEDHNVYAGLGVRVNGFNGLVIPIGLNIYPFPVKKLGFIMELSPIIGEDALLRGSWGIKYRFGNRKN